MEEIDIKKLKLKFNEKKIATVIIIGIVIIASFIFSFIKNKQSFKFISIALTSFDLLLILLCAFISGKINIHKSIIKFKNESKIKNLIYSIILIIGFILIKSLIICILQKISYFPRMNKYEIKFINSYLKQESFIGYSIIFLQIIIVGPIVEELIFRGILLKIFLNKYYEKPFKAIIYSSIVFAIIHINLIQSITSFFGAIILGSIYYYTRSINICIAVHIINNFLVIIPTPKNFFMFIIYIIGGICLIKIGFQKLKNKNEKNVD